jgi:hypothetical protein
MSLPRFPTKPAGKTPSPILTEPPGPWPVNHAVSRPVAQARRRLEHTRKAPVRHAPAERQPTGRALLSAARSDQARPARRPAELTAAGFRSDPE